MRGDAWNNDEQHSNCTCNGRAIVTPVHYATLRASELVGPNVEHKVRGHGGTAMQAWNIRKQ